ncbi:hypothetical protein OG985_48730 (plasmid) [Streptomyces sp. NBC_00289]|uniref:hypothetical protein n=1 Tax=Streptomyces sp. NBC_00289 TaxID=2975703 RepID=UPI0032468E83
MTTTIMTRSAVGATETAANLEYACERCGTWHAGPCSALAHRQLGVLVARMVREADAGIPAGRRARRTVQEMAPGYERQPVLTLYRPVMADDACPLCGRWSCTGSDCPPAASAVPAPVTAGAGVQCDRCGGWFGAAPAQPGPVTAWTCGACQNLGS